MMKLWNMNLTAVCSMIGLIEMSRKYWLSVWKNMWAFPET